MLGRPEKLFSLVPKAIISGPNYGYCTSTLSIKNYYYYYYYYTSYNFGNIVFSISNIVIVPVLVIAVESAKLSTWQCDLYLAVFSCTLSPLGCTECF